MTAPPSALLRAGRLLSLLLLAGLVACSGTRQPTRIQRELLAGAREAAESGDYAAAVSRYRILARAGVARAQRELGRLYAAGRGVPRDPERALSWLRKAAAQGDLPAMRTLAAMLLAGEGTPRNTVAALTWYRLAAERNDPIAMHRLGRLLLRGEEDIAVDLEGAVTWLGEAARRGYLPARIDLADALVARGAPGDAGEAERLYRRARAELERRAETGDAWALEQLGRLHLAGKGVPANARRAAAYYERALARGRERVRLKLARLYRDGGPDLPPDRAAALRLYTVAADAGDAGAAYQAGRILQEGGPEMAPDGRGAAYYLRLAAERGERRAFLRLGDLLADPGLPPTDPAAARHWYLQAGLAGDGKGFYRLGRIAEGAERPARALMWYRLAAEAGYARAESRVARLLRRLSPGEVEESAVELARFRLRNGIAPAAGPRAVPALESPPVQP